MTIRTFRGRTPAEALAQVKRELGPDAVILNTRTERVGGVLGIGVRSVTEITATVDAPGVRRPRRPRTREQLTDQVELSAAPTGVVPPPSAPPRPAQRVAPSPEPQPVAVEPKVPAPSVLEVVEAPPGANMSDEMAVLKRMVGQVLRRSRGQSAGALPAALEQCYLQMIESEVASELADEIVGAVREELSPAELRSADVVRRTVLKHLAGLIQVDADASAPERPETGRPRTIALIGPTGVGKTTTVAKLAATYKLRHGKHVGLVTSDTYRIAAVDQLRTYANIIGLPIEIALTPNEMARACRALQDCDVILIDSAGRSQHDTPRIDELRAFIGAAAPDEVHLVMSCTSSESVLRRTASVFGALDPSHVIFTKLDEAVNFGMLINVVRGVNASLSFVTTGQEVPDQIEHGNADRLARLVLEGGGVR
ncbi:MAG: flagellar biosynthesis protein FlhF [Planctomycetota bacterium]